jgi:hypothetical protein
MPAVRPATGSMPAVRPGTGSMPAVPEGATLSRELADFLIQFSIALHKHAIYPATHPMLAGAVDGIAERLALLLATRPALSLGVARHQLVIEGVATDPDNALLRDLAMRLHNHHVGAVKLSVGVTPDEIGDLLMAVAADADRGGGGPIGDRPAEEQPWPHVRLYPLSYGQLQLLDAEEGPQGDSKVRGASLWIGLARAALAAEDESDVSFSTDPAVVANAIESHQREQAYDQVIVGYLLQIANELKSGERAEGEALRRRISQLVSNLTPETLRRLLDMGGDAGQRRQFVLDAAEAMAADVVLDVARAAAGASGQTISHSLMRLLAKLAAHAEQNEEETTRARADAALREQVQRLVADWALEDPNPDSYRAVLDHMSRQMPLLADPESINTVDPTRLVTMSLELGVATAPARRSVDDLLAQGQAATLIELLDSTTPDNAAAQEMWAHLTTPDRIRALLAEEPVDLGLLEKLVTRSGAAAAEPLLDALATAQQRLTRRKLLTLLQQIGEPVGPLAAARLAGAPWYLQRNLLIILDGLPAWPEEFSPEPYARHEDARVRREAVRMLLKAPAARAEAITAALTDPDPAVVQVALGAALDGCPPGAGAGVARLAAAREGEPHIRALAIRVLAAVRTPEAVETLLRLAFGKKTWLGRQRLAPRSPELLAALAGLSAHWQSDPRARTALALAIRSDDPEVRAAAQGRQR